MLQLFIDKIVKKIRKIPINQRDKIEIGRMGEDLAVKYLKKEKRYKIIDRNWTHNKDEIDIIARDGEVLVFLEVKTQAKDNCVPIYYRVTQKKKTALLRACKAYLRHTRSRHFRFDIVAVKFCQEEKSSIEHYTNVRLFSKNFHTLKDE